MDNDRHPEKIIIGQKKESHDDIAFKIDGETKFLSLSKAMELISQLSSTIEAYVRINRL